MGWIRVKDDADDRFESGTHIAVLRHSETGEIRKVQISVVNRDARCPFCQRPHAVATTGEIDVEADVQATLDEWNAQETRIAAHRQKYGFDAATGRKFSRTGGKQ